MFKGMPKGTPKVSFVMTCYNAERFVGEAVKSLLEQSWRNWECVVVDDGSTDRTGEIVASFGDPRIRLIRPGRIGRGRALNVGLREALGELIAIQDADDLSHPRRLEVQLGLFSENPDLFVLGTGQQLIDGSESFRPHANGHSGHSDHSDQGRLRRIGRSLFFINPVSHTSLMFRREVLQRVPGYDASRRNLFDWDFLFRLSESGFAIWKYSQPLVFKRIHEEQFFERKRQFDYIKSCFALQRSAARSQRLHHLLLVPIAGLFFYRLLPKPVRVMARRCYGRVRNRFL